jgi:hypothetical protein
MTLFLFVALAFSNFSLQAREPHIGYIYPAGGERGSKFYAMIGGQFLRKSSEVTVTGTGVKAKVIKYCRPKRNLDREEREFFLKAVDKVREKRIAELPKEDRKKVKMPKRRYNRKKKKVAKKEASMEMMSEMSSVMMMEAKTDKALKSSMTKMADMTMAGIFDGSKDKSFEMSGAKMAEMTTEKMVPKNHEIPKKKFVQKLPDHPLMHGFEKYSLRELTHLEKCFFTHLWKIQYNRQLAEMCLLEITVAPDAPLGNRELRVKTPQGYTNPVVFQIGALREIKETEPNDRVAFQEISGMMRWGTKLSSDKALELPFVLNGQIMPGDVDRFRFKAKKGQKLTVIAQARSLKPYLADAVPGWFQATISLRDAKNNEIAFSDDYGFNPDPVLFYKVPKDGEYELEIRDSIYRGREDFVYRVAVGELPYATEVFPLGAKAGSKAQVFLKGWNMPTKKLSIDTASMGPRVRKVNFNSDKVSQEILYTVDSLGEIAEKESNDTFKKAQKIALPKIINGRIDRPGDKDVFEFKGKAGDKIAAEVYGRRLNSPLDSLLRIVDSNGKVLKWNDDFYMTEKKYTHKDVNGWMTHHADSCLMAELPKDGTYYAVLSDTRDHGGKAFAYRLRLSAPMPDFAVRATPSSLCFRARRATLPICAHVMRFDGFDGDIQIKLKEPSNGFILKGGLTPADRDFINMTLTAPAKKFKKAARLEFIAVAKTADGRTIERPVIPADDVMQAFLYRHLLPAEEMLANIRNQRWRLPDINYSGKKPFKLPVGGETQVVVKMRYNPKHLKEMQLELKEAPKGVSIGPLKVIKGGVSFVLKADSSAQAGDSDNLIVEAVRFVEQKKKNGKVQPKRRSLVAALPALPVEIVKK